MISFALGVVAGAWACWYANRVAGTSETYRRWYIMCRNVLERIDAGELTGYDALDASRGVLRQIGPRTSPREPWEEVH